MAISNAPVLAADVQTDARVAVDTADVVGASRDNLRLVLFASIAVALLAASSAPSPLYERYNQLWHGSPLTSTVAFGIYALAVLAGLLSLGRLSTHFGRRTVLLWALSGQAVAVLLFATADSYTPLMAGRIIQGLATGAALGTVGAGMIEAHHQRGTVASSAAPAIGTGVGALVSGLVVTFLPWPTHLIYVALLVVFVLQALAVVVLLDSSVRERGALSSLRPRIAVPAPARAAFVTVAPVMFATWALAGFYGSLGPSLSRQMAHSTSIALGGVGLFLLAGVAALAGIVLRDRSARQLMAVGIGSLLLGVSGTVAATLVDSTLVYFVSTAVAGVGFGSAFQGAVKTVLPLAEPSQRAGLLSASFVVSYLGMGIPAVVAGFLASRGESLQSVAVGFGAVVLALSLIAGIGLVRRPAR